MKDFNIEGAIKITGSRHTVEYEPGGMTGLSTLYLSVTGSNKCVPIYIDQIDEVIEMLSRGKSAIEAIENTIAKT